MAHSVSVAQEIQCCVCNAEADFILRRKARPCGCTTDYHVTRLYCAHHLGERLSRQLAHGVTCTVCGAIYTYVSQIISVERL